jgi:hypothetical protein
MTDVRSSRAWSPSYTISGTRGCGAMPLQVKVHGVVSHGGRGGHGGRLCPGEPWSSEGERGGAIMVCLCSQYSVDDPSSIPPGTVTLQHHLYLPWVRRDALSCQVRRAHVTGAGVVMKGGCAPVSPWSSEGERGGAIMVCLCAQSSLADDRNSIPAGHSRPPWLLPVPVERRDALSRQGRRAA